MLDKLATINDDDVKFQICLEEFNEIEKLGKNADIDILDKEILKQLIIPFVVLTADMQIITAIDYYKNSK